MLREEKETIITFDEAGDTAEVYTYNKKLQNKLDALCGEFDSFSHKNQCATGSKSYTIPKARVTITRPRESRKLTEQQKKDLVERLQAGKEDKNE